jgi:hypothetical protein
MIKALPSVTWFLNETEFYLSGQINTQNNTHLAVENLDIHEEHCMLKSLESVAKCSSQYS